MLPLWCVFGSTTVKILKFLAGRQVHCYIMLPNLFVADVLTVSY